MGIVRIVNIVSIGSDVATATVIIVSSVGTVRIAL